jgi:hypothetical protein
LLLQIRSQKLTICLLDPKAVFWIGFYYTKTSLSHPEKSQVWSLFKFVKRKNGQDTALSFFSRLGSKSCSWLQSVQEVLHRSELPTPASLLHCKMHGLELKNYIFKTMNTIDATIVLKKYGNHVICGQCVYLSSSNLSYCI